MKHNLNSNKKKNNSIVTVAATLFTLAFFVVIVAIGLMITPLTAQGSRSGGEEGFLDPIVQRKAPSVVSGDNIYIAWWTNNTENGNEEVMFRASNDGGATFSDKMNLSNSPDTQSQTAEILAVVDNMVFVSWWELNENVHPHTNESVLRVSTDAGQTFGPVVMLGNNGTVSTIAANTTTTTATPVIE
jgi:hypothetical protein